MAGPAFLDIASAAVGRLPEPGEELPTAAIALAPGGFAIAAMALRRLGVDSALAAPRGEDAAGDLLAALLAREGLPWEGPAVPQQPTTIALNRGGDRAFLTAGFPPGQALAQAARTALRRWRPPWLHLSGRGLWALDIAQEAKALGTYISLDCGTDPPWLASDAFRRILRHVDVYLPNAREAACVTGESDPEAAARALSRLAPLAIVKLGADGVFCVRQGDFGHHPTVPVTALDATGAGDVFDAGYIAGRIFGFDDQAAIRLGQYAAGRSILALGGATGAPSLRAARAALPDLPWPER